MNPVTAGLSTPGERMTRGERVSPASRVARSSQARMSTPGMTASFMMRRMFRRYPVTPTPSTAPAPMIQRMARTVGRE